jgi:hypothetical protein
VSNGKERHISLAKHLPAEEKPRFEQLHRQGSHHILFLESPEIESAASKHHYNNNV